MHNSSDDFLLWLNVTNSTYEWINLITGTDIRNYAIIAIYVLVGIVIILPLLGQILFHSVNIGCAILIVAYFYFKHYLAKNQFDEESCKQTLFIWWEWVAKVWFGYEVVGLENIPVNEPVLYVSTHGITPAPVFASRAIAQKVRKSCIFAVIARSHANLRPKKLLQMLNANAWTREECVQFLRNGHDVIVMPGGALEVRHSDSNYILNWGNRKGFAHVAKEARVTIMPCFCVNINEAFWMPFYAAVFLRGRCAPKNLNLAFAVGALPVKLTSIVGKPIPYDPSISVDELFEKTKKAIEDLRDANQRLPGNKFRALLDRFCKQKYKSVVSTDQHPSQFINERV